MDGRAHCVMPENCKVPITLGQRENTGCGESLVCCDVESLDLPCGPNKSHQCVPDDCLLPFHYKFSTECPTCFICTAPNINKIPLSIKEKL
nr:uncharacterized protein Dmel_CG43175, isoform B [Drosophila melanogaster]AHN57377.1 uncharacterized protein Dmel_CG43175, isoform B [Drosophila melanogaster]|eukprot:NP_001287378.1 uncharacterized protein Dmel_CG43175, isoform B [Drosophila melanogaster]